MSAALTYRPAGAKWDYLPQFAQQQLPRYTSYPPANRFTPSIGEGSVANAMERLPDGAAVSLYVHIPYCQKLCWYCGCHTSVPTQADPVESYLAALRLEIRQVAHHLPRSARVTHLHFGGGSPDILTPNQIRELFDELRTSFRFASQAEIAAELDPRGIREDNVAAWASVGLTRASLGVQTLDRGVQERINRVQTPEQVEAAIRLLRSADVSGINIDMMYGLPGQTIAHVLETAMFAAIENADRVAVFGYAHVPWMKKHQKSIHQHELPAGELRFRQAEAAADTLGRAGYVPIGFDHFAAPADSLAIADAAGRLRRNFQGYTDDQAIATLGLGASAISSFPDLIWQNDSDTAAYRHAVRAERLPVARGVALTWDDIRIGRLVERILCNFEADIPSDLVAGAEPQLALLSEAGLVDVRSDHLTVTARGRPYVRNVAACFDPDLQPAAGRHSLAV